MDLRFQFCKYELKICIKLLNILRIQTKNLTKICTYSHKEY